MHIKKAFVDGEIHEDSVNKYHFTTVVDGDSY